MNILRWIARIWGVASIAIVLLFLFGEGLVTNGVWPTATEWIGLLFFPFGLLVGLLLAWRYELAGALVAAGSVVAFYGWNFFVNGNWPVGPFFVLLALPAILFIVLAWWQKHEPPQRMRHV